MPSSKVTAATVAAALATIGLYLVEQYAQVEVPPAVEGAVGVLLTALVTLAAGYLVPERRPAPSAQATLRTWGWRPPSG